MQDQLTRLNGRDAPDLCPKLLGMVPWTVFRGEVGPGEAPPADTDKRSHKECSVRSIALPGCLDNSASASPSRSSAVPLSARWPLPRLARRREGPQASACRARATADGEVPKQRPSPSISVAFT